MNILYRNITDILTIFKCNLQLFNIKKSKDGYTQPNSMKKIFTLKGSNGSASNIIKREIHDHHVRSGLFTKSSNFLHFYI